MDSSALTSPLLTAHTSPCSGGRQLQPQHQTPLHIAAEAGDSEIAEMLLE